MTHVDESFTTATSISLVAAPQQGRPQATAGCTGIYSPLPAFALPAPVTEVPTCGELRRLYRVLIGLVSLHRGRTWVDDTHQHLAGLCLGQRAHHHVLYLDQVQQGHGTVYLQEYFGRRPFGQPIQFDLLLSAALLKQWVDLAVRRYKAAKKGGPALSETVETTQQIPPDRDGWRLVSVTLDPSTDTRTYTWSRVVFHTPHTAATPTLHRAPRKPFHLQEVDRFLADLQTALDQLSGVLVSHCRYGGQVLVMTDGTHPALLCEHGYRGVSIQPVDGPKQMYQFTTRNYQWLRQTVKQRVDAHNSALVPTHGG